MANSLTADQFVTALRAEGVKVIEYQSWRTHNRNHKGAWGPVNGVMLHHTVSSGALSSVELCYNGYAELPGPLCHGVITKDGTVYLVGNGRTNHAGGGDPNVLQAVTDERYNDRPPVPQRGNANGVDGNAHFYGFECINLGNGKDPWPAEQVEAMVRVSAALCRSHVWSSKSAIAHREWSKDKPDPAGPGMPSMPDMRAKIAQRLQRGPSWSPGTSTPPTSGTDMATKPNRQQLIRFEDTALTPDVPYTVYWSTEYQDDGSEHGAGGKTVADNVCYSTVLNFVFTGLPEGGYIEVYPAEENTSGVQTGQGPSADVNGRVGGGTVRAAVPVVGIVGERLVFVVVNRSASTVTMAEARANSQFWPNA